jgi:hypothetical protein
MSPHGGNLEAGVLFHPGLLTWTADEKGQNVQDHLPIQYEHRFTATDSLHSGEPSQPPGEPFIAPPVAWLDWIADAAGGRLVAPSGKTVFTVLDTSGEACAREGTPLSGSATSPVR